MAYPMGNGGPDPIGTRRTGQINAPCRDMSGGRDITSKLLVVFRVPRVRLCWQTVGARGPRLPLTV
jgi:hypothetical protein